MKKLLLFLGIWTAAYLPGSAQKVKNSDVPQVVQNAFKKSYPGSDAKWEKEKGNYEASFKKDGKSMSATFQPDGSFVESETVIKGSELPPAALTYIGGHYKGKKIKECAKITAAGGTVSYEAEIEGKDVIFDEKGNFKEEKD